MHDFLAYIFNTWRQFVRRPLRSLRKYPNQTNSTPQVPLRKLPDTARKVFLCWASSGLPWNKSLVRVKKQVRKHFTASCYLRGQYLCLWFSIILACSTQSVANRVVEVLHKALYLLIPMCVWPIAFRTGIVDWKVPDVNFDNVWNGYLGSGLIKISQSLMVI